MEFAQKRMATQTGFTFGERELKHRVRDNSGEVSFTIDYAALPPNRLHLSPAAAAPKRRARLSSQPSASASAKPP